MEKMETFEAAKRDAKKIRKTLKDKFKTSLKVTAFTALTIGVGYLVVKKAVDESMSDKLIMVPVVSDEDGSQSYIPLKLSDKMAQTD